MTSMEDVLVDCTLRFARGTKSELTGPAKHAWKVAFDKTVGNNLKNKGLSQWDTAGQDYVEDKIDKIAKLAQKKAGKNKISKSDVEDAVDEVINDQRTRLNRLARKDQTFAVLLEWCEGH